MSIPKCTPGSFADLEIRVCKKAQVWLRVEVPAAAKGSEVAPSTGNN